VRNVVPPLRRGVAAAGPDAFRSVLAGLTFAREAVPFKKDEFLSKLEGCPARLGGCPVRLGDVLFELGGCPEGMDYLKNPIKRGIFAKNGGKGTFCPPQPVQPEIRS
jgi:hypothetical protein